MLGPPPSSRPGAGLRPLNCGLRACGSHRRRGACTRHTQIRPRPRAPGARLGENASSAGGDNRAPYVHLCCVPERRQTECYSVSRVAPRVPRGCRAAAFRTVREFSHSLSPATKKPSPQAGPQPSKKIYIYRSLYIVRATTLYELTQCEVHGLYSHIPHM